MLGCAWIVVFPSDDRAGSAGEAPGAERRRRSSASIEVSQKILFPLSSERWKRR